MPNISFWKRNFGMIGFPWCDAIGAVVYVLLVAYLWTVIAHIHLARASETVLKEQVRRASEQQADAEVKLAHLLNGGLLMTDTDYIQCRTRDKASVLLKNGKLP